VGRAFFQLHDESAPMAAEIEWKHHTAHHKEGHLSKEWLKSKIKQKSKREMDLMQRMRNTLLENIVKCEVSQTVFFLKSRNQGLYREQKLGDVVNGAQERRLS